MAASMDSDRSSSSEMNDAERSLVAVLRDKQSFLASLGYPNARRMLKQHDRFVDELKVSEDQFIHVSGEAIQDLGPEHQNQIEVSLSIVSDDAHIGGYVYFGPNAPPDIDTKIFRRPLDPTITYNLCELIDPVGRGGGPPSNKSFERTREG
jgi:hypothetical protein